MNALTRIHTDEEQRYLDIEQQAFAADPAQLSWPVTLPIELALKTASPAELQREYGYTQSEWAALRYDPVFLEDLARACETVRKEGMTFRLKAKLQAEELLKTSWRLIHAPPEQVPPSVKADLIKATMRWAQYDMPGSVGAGGTQVGTALQINIQL